MSLPIPKKAAEIWNRYKSTSTSQNASLIFDRFSLDCVDAKRKKDALETVRDAAAHGDKTLLQKANERLQFSARSDQALFFQMSTEWRMVTGLGRKGPLEVGFTFHRYGFPYLPGSSLKGLARAWMLTEIAEALKTAKLNDLNAALSQENETDAHLALTKLPLADSFSSKIAQFRLLFGTTACAGRAIFFDALPATLPRLEIDIMNPHYTKYYQKGNAPTDSDNPIPVYFLTVAPEIPFNFAVGWRGPLDPAGQQAAKDALVNGLSLLGAGGKTSAGYGYFTGLKET